MWKHDTTLPSYPMLSDSIKADVCIVGAGITGLTAAYLLSKSGRSVVVVERNTIGSGATAYTTGFLCQIIDTNLSDAERIWGTETAKMILEGHRAAIDTIEKISVEEKIECEFVRCPNIIFTQRSDEALTEELAAAKRLGLEATRADVASLGFVATGAIEIQHQAKFHPLKYLKGLAERATASGVRIFEHTCARDIEAGRLLYTDHGLIEADDFLFATYAPFEQPPGLFFKKGTYDTYIMELKMAKNVDIPEGTYEDDKNPYHYFRIDHLDDGTRVLVGGEDHRRGIPLRTKSRQALDTFVRETFSDTSYTVVDHWSGPIIEPSDGLPIIGPYEYDNTFYASGFSGNGLTYGTLAALIFCDYLEDRPNAWLPIFSARRILSFKGLAIKGRDYVEEFFGALKNVIKKAPPDRRVKNSGSPILHERRAQ